MSWVYFLSREDLLTYTAEFGLERTDTTEKLRHGLVAFIQAQIGNTKYHARFSELALRHALPLFPINLPTQKDSGDVAVSSSSERPPPHLTKRTNGNICDKPRHINVAQSAIYPELETVPRSELSLSRSRAQPPPHITNGLDMGIFDTSKPKCSDVIQPSIYCESKTAISSKLSSSRSAPGRPHITKKLAVSTCDKPKPINIIRPTIDSEFQTVSSSKLSLYLGLPSPKHVNVTQPAIDTECQIISWSEQSSRSNAPSPPRITKRLEVCKGDITQKPNNVTRQAIDSEPQTVSCSEQSLLRSNAPPPPRITNELGVGLFDTPKPSAPPPPRITKELAVGIGDTLELSDATPPAMYSETQTIPCPSPPRITNELEASLSDTPKPSHAIQPTAMYTNCQKLFYPKTDIDQIRKCGLFYDGYKDPLSFLQRVEEFTKDHKIDNNCILRALPQLLKGKAMEWYRKNNRRWQFWDAFKWELLLSFTSPKYFDESTKATPHPWNNNSGVEPLPKALIEEIEAHLKFPQLQPGKRSFRHYIDGYIFRVRITRTNMVTITLVSAGENAWKNYSGVEPLPEALVKEIKTYLQEKKGKKANFLRDVEGHSYRVRINKSGFVTILPYTNWKTACKDPNTKT